VSQHRHQGLSLDGVAAALHVVARSWPKINALEEAADTIQRGDLKAGDDE
jgi:hypothetical protein